MPAVPVPQVLGHLAAARTTAKLNLVSSRLFPLPAGVRAPQQAGGTPAAEAEAAGPPSSGAVAAGELAAGVQPEVAGCDKTAPDEPAREETGSGSPGRAKPAGAAAQLGAASSSGLVHVRQLSVLAWRQQKAQQPSTAAAGGGAAAVPGDGPAQQPQLRLVVEPAEGLAAAAAGGGFDAAAVQQEVQQERPQLAAQLALLREREQHGQLPGREQLQSDGLPAWQCRQNCVTPPPPPPLPPAQLAHPVQPQGWQQAVPVAMQPHAWQQPWLAVPGQPYLMPQQQLAQLPLPPQQQAWQQPPPPPPQQQQGGIMRPLYHHQPLAQPHATPQQPQYHQIQQQLAMHPYAWQPAAGAVLMPRPPLPPPPAGEPPLQPPEAAQSQAAPQQQQQQPPQQPPQQQQQPGPDNKRAAGDLKARLQGAKRQRKPDGGPSSADAAIDGAGRADEAVQPRQGEAACAKEDERQELPQQQPEEQQAWLEGAPPGIRQLAALQHGGSKGSSGRNGSSGGGPEVLFLGTGSAEPSKYRGASAIQLRCVLLSHGLAGPRLTPCWPRDRCLLT